jgi:hypothetical protein
MVPILVLCEEKLLDSLWSKVWVVGVGCMLFGAGVSRCGEPLAELATVALALAGSRSVSMGTPKFSMSAGD